MSNSAEGGGDRRRRRRGKRVRVAQRIRNGSEPHGRTRVDFDVARQGKKIKTEGSVLWYQLFEEGGNIRRCREALWVHAKPRTEDIELLKAARAACVSHRIGLAKDVAHVEARLGGKEQGRHGGKVLKRTLRRLVRCSLVREVEGSRERV
eukprot:166925-Pleurochrysis_carterae.AAC.1